MKKTTLTTIKIYTLEKIMSIHVNNISKNFNKKPILKSISFKANPGEVIGILGENGAGKSTLMKIITGHYKANKGNVTICDKDTLSDSLFTKSKTGYLSEDNPLYEEMYVCEFLEFICDIHKISYDNCDKIITLTGLEKEKHKQIKFLSKGFQQRVGLAQALMHNPELIILDEPTSGLDPKQLIEIRKIIKQIGKKKTILLSSHIIQEIEAMCDRIIIIHNGQIIADKKIEEFEGEIEESFLKLIK